MMRTLSFFCLFLLIASPALAAKPGDAKAEPTVKATLLCDSESIQPGGKFTLGVLLKMKPHWHTYWVSPGDSGEPTRVKLQAPAGFTFDAIQWPIPSRIEGDGFVSYGYENEVLLLIPGQAPKDLKPGAIAEIEANVSWLVCHETCIEGGAILHMELASAAKAKPANEKLFAAWHARLPVAASASEGAAALVSVKQAKKADGSPEPVLTLNWKKAPARVEWYPIADSALMIDKIEVKHEGEQTTIRFRADVYKPEKLPTGVIDSVVVLVDEKGQRTGITVPFGVLKPE